MIIETPTKQLDIYLVLINKFFTFCFISFMFVTFFCLSLNCLQSVSFFTSDLLLKTTMNHTFQKESDGLMWQGTFCFH